MKVAKMRAKARAAFNRPAQILYLDDAGNLSRSPVRQDAAVVVPVVQIRGRIFTKPQCARQRPA